MVTKHPTQLTKIIAEVFFSLHKMLSLNKDTSITIILMIDSNFNKTASTIANYKMINNYLSHSIEFPLQETYQKPENGNCTKIKNFKLNTIPYETLFRLR